MTANSDNLIEALRNEMQEYGGLLSLFTDQQTAILERNPDAVVAMQNEIRLQVEAIHACRKLREKTARDLAIEVGQSPESSVRQLIESCEAMVRPLLNALIYEVNQLISKTRRRGQQNQMLLARSIEVSQQILQKLNPGALTKTYSRQGRLSLARGGAGSRTLARS